MGLTNAIRNCTVEYFKKVLYGRLDSFGMRMEKVVRRKLSLPFGKDVIRTENFPTTDSPQLLGYAPY